MNRSRLARIFWIGAAAILVAAALVALVAVLRGDFSDTDVRILGTLTALLYVGGTALAGLALVERGPTRALGWAVVAAAPICLSLVTWGIWSLYFDGAGNYDATRSAWSAVLVLLVGLVAATGLLLAQGQLAVALAWGATGLAACAAALSVVGIWAEPDDETYVQALAVLWILAGLCYFLAPVLQRFTTVGPAREERVLAELDGVELVVTHANEGIDVRLARGEQLALRRRLTS